jgi:hypothetical protein
MTFLRLSSGSQDKVCAVKERTFSVTAAGVKLFFERKIYD